MRRIILLALVAGFLVSACATQKPFSVPVFTPTLSFTSTPFPTVTPSGTPTPARTPTQTPVLPETDTGWRVLRSGLEKREIEVVSEKRRLDHLLLLRIDPTYFRFEIAYDAEHPKFMDGWQKQTGALIVFNGGFFKVESKRYLPAGLLIIGGQRLGETYRGYGGMFAVTMQGPQLRSLALQPYQPSEQFMYALQSFPLLVKPGGLLGFPAQDEDYVTARRTVLGRDRDGRFIVMVTSSVYFTLYRLSRYLVDSDLDLDVALNLDGGPSSGVVLAEPYTLVAATASLPIVIAVYPR